MKILLIILCILTIIGDVFFAYKAYEDQNRDAFIPWITLAIIMFVQLIGVLI